MKCTAKNARTTLAMNALSPISTEDGVQRDVVRKFEGESTEVAKFFMKTRLIESHVLVNYESKKASEWNPDHAIFVI